MHPLGTPHKPKLRCVSPSAGRGTYPSSWIKRTSSLAASEYLPPYAGSVPSSF
jgi:hypothetical protein